MNSELKASIIKELPDIIEDISDFMRRINSLELAAINAGDESKHVARALSNGWQALYNARNSFTNVLLEEARRR